MELQKEDLIAAAKHRSFEGDRTSSAAVEAYSFSRAGQISNEQMRAISLLNDMFARNLTAVATVVSNIDQHCEPGPKQCVATPPSTKERCHANNQKRRIEAGLCGDGSCEAARDRQQGRKGESWRRPQSELEPLVIFFGEACAPDVGPFVRRLSSLRCRNAQVLIALTCGGVPIRPRQA